jgi:hypothetical protein
MASERIRFTSVARTVRPTAVRKVKPRPARMRRIPVRRSLSRAVMVRAKVCTPPGADQWGVDSYTR